MWTTGIFGWIGAKMKQNRLSNLSMLEIERELLYD